MQSSSESFVDGVLSKWLTVTSGVPQGSILGPVRIVIFINDLPDFAETKIDTALYADGTKVYNLITSCDDCKRLQRSLTNLNK